jgi:putative membrane protein
VWASAITAYFHYLSIGIIFAALAIEFFTLKEELNLKEAWRILWADSAYGIAAIIVLVTGILRVLYFAKDTAYYLNNPIFWVKIGVYLIVGTVSLYPTISFLKWIKSLMDKKVPEITINQYKRLKGVIIFELIGFSTIPLFASMMARGIGIN